jgi:hypothetical protein
VDVETVRNVKINDNASIPISLSTLIDFELLFTASRSRSTCVGSCVRVRTRESHVLEYEHTYESAEELAKVVPKRWIQSSVPVCVFLVLLFEYR